MYGNNRWSIVCAIYSQTNFVRGLGLLAPEYYTAKFYTVQTFVRVRYSVPVPGNNATTRSIRIVLSSTVSARARRLGGLSRCRSISRSFGYRVPGYSYRTSYMYRILRWCGFPRTATPTHDRSIARARSASSVQSSLKSQIRARRSPTGRLFRFLH